MGAITIIVVVAMGASAKSGGVVEWGVGLLDVSRWYWTQTNGLETRPHSSSGCWCVIWRLRVPFMEFVLMRSWAFSGGVMVPVEGNCRDSSFGVLDSQTPLWLTLLLFIHPVSLFVPSRLMNMLVVQISIDVLTLGSQGFWCPSNTTIASNDRHIHGPMVLPIFFFSSIFW